MKEQEKVGFLAIDKPPGITSHDVVALLRAVTGERRVGHTGTLDPFATGVLALAFGTATRLIPFLDEDYKVYEATIAFGAATDTGDPTGATVRTAPVPALDRERVEAALAGLTGTLMLAPPRYSAVKVRGRPMYAWAREGRDVEAAPRPTRIDRFDLLELHEDAVRVRITCGRGTYARVLAEEVAAALGTVGHLRALRRTWTGPFSVDRALALDELSLRVAGSADWRHALRPARGAERVPWAPRDQVWIGLEPWRLPPRQALSHLPSTVLSALDLRRMSRGGRPPAPPPGVGPGGRYLALCGDAVVAVIAASSEGPRVERLLAEG